VIGPAPEACTPRKQELRSSGHSQRVLGPEKRASEILFLHQGDQHHGTASVTAGGQQSVPAMLPPSAATWHGASPSPLS
jgi:hypothetical protein